MAEETQIPEVLSALFREADAVGEELKRMLPDLAEARRTYCASRSEEDRQQLEDIEKRAKDLHAKHGEIVTAMQVASGIPEEVLAELEGEQVSRLCERGG